MGLIGRAPPVHLVLIGDIIRGAKGTRDQKRQQRKTDSQERIGEVHRGYFFPSAPASCNDLGSERFLGEAFCSALTISWPDFGVAALCPITTSRAEILRP